MTESFLQGVLLLSFRLPALRFRKSHDSSLLALENAAAVMVDANNFHLIKALQYRQQMTLDFFGLYDGWTTIRHTRLKAAACGQLDTLPGQLECGF